MPCIYPSSDYKIYIYIYISTDSNIHRACVSAKSHIGTVLEFGHVISILLLNPKQKMTSSVWLHFFSSCGGLQAKQTLQRKTNFLFVFFFLHFLAPLLGRKKRELWEGGYTKSQPQVSFLT